jgi:DNA polymerase elongation subunit (family B)
VKILTLDVETAPHLSFHFGRWQLNIPSQHTISESRIISWAAKWYDEKDIEFSSEWEDGPDYMMERMWELLDEADTVIGYNSDKFDIKRINTEFFLRGWDPYSPLHSVDLFKQVKKHFAMSSNRLKDVLKARGLTPKLEEFGGMALWMDVVYKELKSAQKRMKSYNKQDVASTEELYDAMLGWITNHPNWGLYVDVLDGTPICPNCGGTCKEHKTRNTKVRTYMQYRCTECGKYARGRASIGDNELMNGVLNG